MGQTIAVTVKGFSVTESLDPNPKRKCRIKLKPKAVSALKNVQGGPAEGKNAGPVFRGHHRRSRKAQRG